MTHLAEGARQTDSHDDELGVTSIEYGLLATAVALLVAAGVASLGPKILALFQSF